MEAKDTNAEIEAALGTSKPAHTDPLEDLYTDALLNRKQRAPRAADPSLRHALDAATKKMRDLYQLPENWERRRGLAIVDGSSNTLVGNFSEYVHRTVPKTRKLIREHTPIAIDAMEVHDGYLGSDMELRVRGHSWEREYTACIHLLLDELMVEAPKVNVMIKSRLGAIIRVELTEETQFASPNGNLLILASGTNIWEACGQDTKIAVRRQVT